VCQLTITREDTGQQLYLNAWVTNYQIDADNVTTIAQYRPFSLENRK
jgi:hypothetical protein